MSIVGCTVVHANWGCGTIVSLNDGVITVRFFHTLQGEKSIRFQFPTAFIQGFLVGADDTSTKRILTALSERKCSICECDALSTELIDGNRYCPSCKKQHTTLCAYCGEYHNKESFIYIRNRPSSYVRTPICPNCISSHTFTCDRCHEQHFITHRASKDFNGRTLCTSCFDSVAKICHFCNSAFDLDKGTSIYRYEGTVHVCPDCKEVETFICSECGDRRLNSNLVDSKYVPADRKVCRSCVESCVICNTSIDTAHTTKAFGKRYCPDCWRKMSVECSCCGDDFVPENTSNQLCPDCIEMEAYISRYEQIHYLSLDYKNISYYYLEQIDRCDLFTNLYRHCSDAIGRYGLAQNTDDPFYFLVMDLYPYKLVISYLSKSVIGKVRYSENVTMTQFRTRKGRMEVRDAIANWADKSTHFLDTTAGKMKMLNYPILLRVQTDFDKHYGKLWNGPDDYIEIGNYGDTTDFYIIGLL